MRDDARDLSHIPGNEGLPLVGNTFRVLRDPQGFARRMRETYGPLYRNRALGRVVLNAADADLSREILLDRERCFSSEKGWGHTIGELFPRGLMLRDFDDHKRHRRIMQGAFGVRALQAYHRGVEVHSRASVEAWVAQGSLEFYPAVKRALLEQAATVFLGIPLGERAQALSDAFVAMLAASIAVVRRPIPGTVWWRGLRGRQRLVRFLSDEIPARRAGEGEDLFSLLCRAQDEDGDRFDDGEIVDHMIFLLMAAHDTTTSGLTTLVQELACAPDWQDTLREECRAVVPAEGPLPFESLAELVQVDAAFREALRLNPPVRMLFRRTERPCRLAGHELPARTPVNVHVEPAQLDPAFWTDPERFDPGPLRARAGGAQEPQVRLGPLRGRRPHLPRHEVRPPAGADRGGTPADPRARPGARGEAQPLGAGAHPPAAGRPARGAGAVGGAELIGIIDENPRTGPATRPAPSAGRGNAVLG